MNKTALALILIFATSSLMIVESANAQTIPKPSVPEFTIQIVAYPYDVPTTTSIDPYSGEEIIHQGYHVENNSIQVRIKNQAFNPFDITENGNSWTINLCYNIRIRGHFAEQSQDWIELYRASDGYPHQWSDSDYTILLYPLRVDSSTFLGTKMIDLTAGDKVDFQVEAMSGYTYREVTSIPGSGWIFAGVTSGWSNTQTISIPDGAISISTPNPTSPTTSTPTTTQTPTSSPIAPDTNSDSTDSITLPLTTFIVVTAFLAAIIVTLSVLAFRRHRKTTNLKP